MPHCSHAVRGTMFVRNGAVTPGPSRKCDIAFFLKGRPKSAQHLRDSAVAARGVQSVTVPSCPMVPECRSLGARLRGRTATQRSKKGSEKGSWKGSGKGSEKGACCGFYSKKGF